MYKYFVSLLLADESQKKCSQNHEQGILMHFANMSQKQKCIKKEKSLFLYIMHCYYPQTDVLRRIAALKADKCDSEKNPCGSAGSRIGLWSLVFDL